MTTPLPKATRDALLVTATAMLAPFRPQGDIDRAVDALLAALDGEAVTASTRQPSDRVLSAKEVAALLHRSTKTVRTLARRGLIRRVHMGAGQRAGGYSLQSINAFLNGKAEG